MEIHIARDRVRTRVPAWRPAALATIGPLTVLGGAVWAVAQPYRLTLLSDTRGGLWDHVAQPPLLVIAVGLFFELVVARPLVRALKDEP